MTGATIVAGSMPPKATIDTSTYSGRVAARMRALREERGWTVKDLAERLRSHLGAEEPANSTVQGWDNGSRVIHPDFYPALASLFRKSVRGFLPAE